jgi:hypothetical protein
MALQKTITWNGLTVTDAYYKVASIDGDKESIRVVVNMSAGAEHSPLKQDVYIVPLDINGDNFIKQAYTHLKTLPEFADAVDV